FSDLYTAADVVSFYFLGAAALDAGGLVRNARVGEGAAHHARPLQLVGLESGGGANVRLGIEADAHRLKYLSDGSNEGGIQMLLAEAVIAGVAFDALVAIDGGAVNRPVDVDSAHRADVGAIAAGHAFVRIDLHASNLSTGLRGEDALARVDLGV